MRTDAPGVTVRPLEGLDVTRRGVAIELDDVAVDGRRRRRRTGRASPTSCRRRCSSAAESVGAMHADFDVALQYAKDRIAFGRPIGSFQAIKHLLADTSLGLEMSKAMVGRRGRRRSARRARRRPRSRSMAKAFVAEQRRRAGPELLPGVRRHRVHVGARPAPLLPPPRGRRRARSGSASWHRERCWQFYEPWG